MNPEKKYYDVVIAGGGVAGLLFAKRIIEDAIRNHSNLSVLLLEAGVDLGQDQASYKAMVDRFHAGWYKTPNAPYLDNRNAPVQPDIPPLAHPEDLYYRKDGKHGFGSNNTRAMGGTTLHWMGIALRMLPEDFKMADNYGCAVNWPIDYEDMRPYYQQAEQELGVAGNADEQNHSFPRKGDPIFEKDYDLPMEGIVPSYHDQQLKKRSGEKLEFKFRGKTYETHYSGVPQARNSTPRKGADGKNFRPKAAPFDMEAGVGQRCEGNASCIPICPVNAKYNALRTLEQVKKLAKSSYITLEIQSQSIATRLHLKTGKHADGAQDCGRIRALEYDYYPHSQLASKATKFVEAHKFVLAASAIENAKILLASGRVQSQEKFANSSDQVGRNLMDHPFVLNWGYLADEGSELGTFRGPGVTTDFPVRDGPFRRKHAGFRTDVSNWGWGLADGAPFNDLERLIDPQNERWQKQYAAQLPQLLPSAPLYGSDLRKTLRNDVQRQVTLGYLFEQLPRSENRVTISSDWVDRLGNFKPVIDYEIHDYTLEAMACARAFTKAFFKQAGIEDCTITANAIGETIDGNDGDQFVFIGAGHIMGTHRMGTSQKNSVVNSHQLCWEHDNLYILGAGSMPTAGTSNPTLTLAALSLRSADHFSKNRRK